jgi:hypothetical protein
MYHTLLLHVASKDDIESIDILTHSTTFVNDSTY